MFRSYYQVLNYMYNTEFKTVYTWKEWSVSFPTQYNKRWSWLNCITSIRDVTFHLTLHLFKYFINCSFN